MKEHLKSKTLPELAEILKALGQPAFRAKQVYSWLHRGVRSYEEMTNLPQALRAALAEKYPILPPKVLRKQESQKDGTIKYLWQLCRDGADALPLRQYCLYLHRGGLPYGLCLLRFHSGRSCAKAGAL